MHTSLFKFIKKKRNDMNLRGIKMHNNNGNSMHHNLLQFNFKFSLSFYIVFIFLLHILLFCNIKVVIKQEIIDMLAFFLLLFNVWCAICYLFCRQTHTPTINTTEKKLQFFLAFALCYRCYFAVFPVHRRQMKNKMKRKRKNKDI